MAVVVSFGGGTDSTAMLAEYDYPANPQNAGRAGWRAARLYSITAQGEQKRKGGV